MSKQPEALRLAQLSEELAADEALLHCWPWPSLAKLYRDDAAELRRLHSVNAELLSLLQDFAGDFAATTDLDVRAYVNDARDAIARATPTPATETKA